MKTYARIATTIAHGIVVGTMLAIAVAVFPWFSSRYEGAMGRLPEAYRGFQALSHFLRANGLCAMLAYLAFLYADFRLVARIRREEIRISVTTGFVVLLCAFLAWFFYAASSPDRYIERMREANPGMKKAPDKATEPGPALAPEMNAGPSPLPTVDVAPTRTRPST